MGAIGFPKVAYVAKERLELHQNPWANTNLIARMGRVW